MNNVVKDVSDNPGKNAVTQPNDQTWISKDVQNKINLYNIYEAFRAGKAPSNDQIDRTLKHVNEHSPIDESKLSSEGRNLVEDFRKIIETARIMVKEKNADELVQNFLYTTRPRDEDSAQEKGEKAKKKVEHPISKEDAKKDADEGVQHLRTLGKLFFTNAEFRKLLQDSGIIGRDIATDAATKAADFARPTEEQLNQTDEAAPSNRWVGADGQTYGENDAVPDTGLAEKREKAKQAKEEKQQSKEEAKKAKEEAKNEAEKTKEAARQEGKTEKEASEAAATEGKKTFKDRAFQNVSEKNKERFNQNVDSSKEYVKEKFPQERRDRFIFRLKKVIVEQQRHRDYQEAIDFFLRMLETYKGHAGSYASQGSSRTQEATNTSSFKEAKTQFTTLLERFANGKSIKPIFDAVDKIYKAAQSDEDLKNWFKDLDSYARRILQEPGYVMRTQADEEGRKLRESGKKFFNDKYKGHRDEIFDSIKVFFSGFGEDPLNKRFGSDWKQLAKDLLFDSDGKLQFKSHLWGDVRSQILPPLARRIGAIPIPRIEYTDKETDLVIENLILESQNILPNIFEVEAKNYFKLSQYSSIKDKGHHSVWVSFSQIQADLRNVAFYFHRKAGFPKIKDHGRADVFLGGKGISGKVHLESTEQKGSFFKIKEINVKVDTLKFKIRNSGHQILYNAVRPLASRLIKKQISKAMEGAIRSGLVQLDGQLAEVKDRFDANKEKGEDAVSKSQIFKDVFSKKEEEKKESKGTFQLVSRRDSKLIDYAVHDSIVERTSAGADVAKEGHGWKSPIFDIVDKQASSNATQEPATQRAAAAAA